MDNKEKENWINKNDKESEKALYGCVPHTALFIFYIY